MTTATTLSARPAPAGPVNSPGNVHDGEEAFGASTTPIRAPHVEFARVARFPYTLSVSDVILAASTALSLRTVTVWEKVPPGWAMVDGPASWITVIAGRTLTTATVVSSVAVPT